MSLQLLLNETTRQHFVSEYYHRLPIAKPDAASELRPLGTWEVLGNLLRQPADLMVVRQGQRVAGDVPASIDEARRLVDEGCTILVRHAERHDDRLRELAASFERDLGAPVNIHMYVTAAGSHGFSWHYDAEDVFIIQTVGAKEYSLRKNTVNPWPLEETLPHDMRYERELMPLMRVTLHAGDWLYIPCGYWHKADALPGDEAAISLAVGVMSRAAIDLLDFARTRLVDSILWRMRLPVMGDASPLSTEELDRHLAEICAQLAEDLSQTLRSETFIQEYREANIRRRDDRQNPETSI